jgi:hypothetical protein
MIKKIFWITVLSFVIANGSAYNFNLPPLEISRTGLLTRSLYKFNSIENKRKEMAQMIQSCEPARRSTTNFHNKGILELKPKWFPKSAKSKRGERTYYYWEF